MRSQPTPIIRRIPQRSDAAKPCTIKNSALQQLANLTENNFFPFGISVHDKNQTVQIINQLPNQENKK